MMPSTYYDTVFERSDRFKCHYTGSGYYPAWAIVGDRIRSSASVPFILELGCGTGQFAQFLQDFLGYHLGSYHGIDFSQEALSQSVARLGGDHRFLWSKVDLSSGLPREFNLYNWVIALEFLEHMDRDVEILQSLRPGVPVLLTVPSFRCASHVRHFRTVEEVTERYLPEALDLRSVVRLRLDKTGEVELFILEGRTKQRCAQ